MVAKLVAVLPQKVKATKGLVAKTLNDVARATNRSADFLRSVARIDSKGDLEECGGHKTLVSGLSHDNIGAGSNAWLKSIGGSGSGNSYRIPAPADGSIIGVAVWASAALTSGESLRVRTYRFPVSTPATPLVLSDTTMGAAERTHRRRWPKDKYQFFAGDTLGIYITTSSSWTDTTLDFFGSLWLEM